MKAQQAFYENKWKEVDSLVLELDRPETALKITNELYGKAIAEKNYVQQLNAIRHIIYLNTRKEENAELAAIRLLEKETPRFTGVYHSIALSFTAEAYWNYLIENDYELSDRTSIQDTSEKNIDKWTTEQLHEKISSLYIQSLKDAAPLQQTSIDGFEPLLKKGNSSLLRPTVYDLLAHRALEYFYADDRNSTEPVTPFELNDTALFADVKSFLEWKPNYPDSSDKKILALKILQQLTRFHLDDKEPSALVDIAIERMEFVHEHATLENKDSLYINALESITSKYPLLAAAAQAWYLQAEFHAAIGRTYNPSAEAEISGQETARLSFLKALELCRKGLATPAPSEGYSNCLQLEKELTQSMLNVFMEEVVIPGKPALMLLEYRNIDRLYYRIIKQDKDYWKKDNERGSRHDWLALVKSKYLQSFDQKLPGTGDLQLHRVEMMINALEPGQYSILFSTSPEFEVDSVNMISAIDFQVSSIGLINQSTDNFIVNRESGMPLAGASANIYKRALDEKAANLVFQLIKTHEADQNGWFTTKDTSTQNYSRQVIEISNNSDRLFINTYTGYNRYEDEDNKITDKKKFEDENRQVFYFTDRSIYRPGQTIEFKGLVITRDASTREPKIEAGFKTVVSLHDANDEVIDSIEVTTNSFGSFHGKFQLPSGSLNGTFRISSSSVNGSADFSVEEYKRPKFSVELVLPGETYMVNDHVKLEGKATAYAGNAISNARVRYRVTRTSMLPYWMSYRFSRFPSRDEKEITNGFTTTDDAGNFKVEFNAVPDKKMDSSLFPVFQYKVSADVTDINGETHSGIQFIKAGYKPFILDLPGNMEWNDQTIPSIIVEAQNMNGRKIHADITATIIPLQEPGRIMRKRLWSKPDQFIMSETEFRKNFPIDIYNNEDQFNSWKEEKALRIVKDTANKKLVLSPKPLQQGWYLLQLTAKDSTGQQVSTKRYFQVTGQEAMQGPAYATITANSTSIEVDDELKYSIQTNLSPARIILQEISNDSAGDYQFRIKNRKPLTESKKIKSSQQGTYRIIMAMVKDNRFYTDEQNIQVPFVGKDLEVKLETYRDKTLPGSNEKWTLSVQDKKGNPVLAELASVLYDESLDQLRMHEWYKPFLWTRPLKANSFSAAGNFSISHSVTDRIDLPEWDQYEKTYDQLNYSPYQERMNNDIIFYSMKSERMAIPEMVESSFDDDLEEEDSTSSGIKKEQHQETNIPPRKDFRETAYFIPQLLTGENGKAEISFTIPETLTRWKSISFAHTHNLAMGMTEGSIITQKPLMVQPNMPRFLREGDRIDLVTKIVNMTDTEMTGQVELQLIDPETNQPVDGWFRNFFPNQYFTAASGESVASSFSIEVPYLYGKPVVYRVYVRSGSTTDAEEGIIPVLTNRVLVTETMAIAMQQDTIKKLEFTNLLKSDSSENLTHHKLTVEYTANPSWLVVQSLPYLEQNKNGSSNEVFGRIYANAIAAKVLRTNPLIEEVMKSWSSNDTGYLSKLEQNKELKDILLQQTPWVFEAKQESARQKDLVKLFDSKANAIAMDEAIAELRNLQQDNGAFSWMPKGPSDRFITQEILIGIGRLISLHALDEKQEAKLVELAKKALPYTHEQITRDYELAKKSKSASIHTLQLHYLYMLTYYQHWGVTATSLPAFTYYRKLAQKQWIKLNRYGQAVAALFLSRTGDKHTASKIIRALQENALHSPELGMYWKETTGGYYWYQSAIEAQAFIIEAFHELNAPKQQVNELKTWLLKNRQTNNWGNVSATADACYALLTTGDDWLKTTPEVSFRLGNTNLQSTNDKAAQTMPGYFKTSIPGTDVKPSMGNIEVRLHSEKPVNQPSWGAVYWQYFEDMNQVKSSSGALKMERKVYVESNSDKGPILEPVTEGQMLKIGDRIKVVISLDVDRAMEYIHISDMRAAALEPLQVISGYTWKGALGYYQSTHDASTDFFIDHLPKGHHQLEYTLVVTNAGTFSNGLTRAQCMYAPEFISYAEGIRIMVENN